MQSRSENFSLYILQFFILSLGHFLIKSLFFILALMGLIYLHIYIHMRAYYVLSNNLMLVAYTFWKITFAKQLWIFFRAAKTQSRCGRQLSTVRTKSFESKVDSICSWYLKGIFLPSSFLPMLFLYFAMLSYTPRLIKTVVSQLFLFHIAAVKECTKTRYFLENINLIKENTLHLSHHWQTLIWWYQTEKKKTQIKRSEIANYIELCYFKQFIGFQAKQ